MINITLKQERVHLTLVIQSHRIMLLASAPTSLLNPPTLCLPSCCKEFFSQREKDTQLYINYHFKAEVPGRR